VNDENGHLLAVSQNISNTWKNYFSQLLNMHNVHDVRQIEVHTSEPLVPDLNRLEVEIGIAKLRKCKSPGSDQIPAELLQAGGEILLSAIHKLINFVCNKEDLPDQFTRTVIKLTVIITVVYHYCQLQLSTVNFQNFVSSRLHSKKLELEFTRLQFCLWFCMDLKLGLWH
jgi:hypothetical protein